MFDGQVLVSDGFSSELHVGVHSPQSIDLKLLIWQQAAALGLGGCLFFLFLRRTILRLWPAPRSNEALQVIQVKLF